MWVKNKAANHVAIKYQPLRLHEDVLVFFDGGCNTGSLKPIKFNPQDVIWKSQSRFRTKDVIKKGVFRYNALKAGSYEVVGSNYPRSILPFEVPSGRSKIYPTQKPVALMSYLIKSYSDKDAVILDSCMGSGTTGVACIESNRNFIGIEKNVVAFKLARSRLLKALGK